MGTGSAQLWRVASPPPRRGGKIALHLHCVDHSRNAFAAPCLRARACSNSCKSRRFIFRLSGEERKGRDNSGLAGGRITCSASHLRPFFLLSMGVSGNRHYSSSESQMQVGNDGRNSLLAR
jgi:hypothetical protein